MEVKEVILATDTERQKAVQEIFTLEFNKILIKYSIYRIKMKFNIDYDLHRGFRGIMVEDIINDLMFSFIKKDGGRNWNKSEFNNFKDQVFSSLDSQISNTIKKEFEKTTKTNEIDENNQPESQNDNNYDELLEFSISYLKEIGASDDELLLFEPYVIHQMKRKDIADEFGISEQEATNIKKRILRKIPALHEQIKNMNNGK